VKLPNVNKPCKDCPFRKDSLKGWLGKERMAQILKDSVFVCHKKQDLQCAGHMIIKKEGNDFYSLAGRLNLNTGLSGHDLVFDSEVDCIDHHT